MSSAYDMQSRNKQNPCSLFLNPIDPVYYACLEKKDIPNFQAPEKPTAYCLGRCQAEHLKLGGLMAICFTPLCFDLSHFF